MGARRLFGLLGSLLGLVFPAVMLVATRPPFVWYSVGGYGTISFMLLDAGRPRRYWLPPEDIIAPEKVECPGGEEGHRRALRESPLPDGPPGERPYAGLVACLLVSPAGQVIRVQLVDSEGKRVSRPGIAATILTAWRFEPSTRGWRALGWQPIPLEGRKMMEQYGAHGIGARL